MRSLLFLSLIFVFFSCGQSEELPEDVMNEKEFISVMVQIQLMESYCQDHFVRPDHYRDVLDRSVDSLLHARGFSKEEYEASFEYYSHDPEKMFKIYEAVLDSMNQMVVKVNSVQK